MISRPKKKENKEKKRKKEMIEIMSKHIQVIKKRFANYPECPIIKEKCIGERCAKYELIIKNTSEGVEFVVGRCHGMIEIRKGLRDLGIII